MPDLAIKLDVRRLKLWMVLVGGMLPKHRCRSNQAATLVIGVLSPPNPGAPPSNITSCMYTLARTAWSTSIAIVENNHGFVDLFFGHLWAPLRHPVI